uniref:Histidine-containing phosphotransfer protein n=1 Tax=Aegilops tauschii TaxID=37682 RepID=N1QTK4_AEGTA
MAAAALRARLDNRVTSMFATGMLDDNFQQLQSMGKNETTASGYVAEMINLFIKETKRILNDIAGLLSAPNPTSLPLLQLSRLARSGTNLWWTTTWWTSSCVSSRGAAV